MEAYRWISEEFSLRAKQRDALDSSDLYEEIMDAGNQRNWTQVKDLLIKAQILPENFKCKPGCKSC